MSDNRWYAVADIRTTNREALEAVVLSLPEEHTADFCYDTIQGGLVNVLFTPSGTDPATVKVEAQAFLIRALGVSADDVEVCNLTRESDMQMFEFT